MIETFTHSTFAELKGTKFKLYDGSDEPVEVELIDVGEFVESKRQEMFGIFFSIPEGKKPAQGTYGMEHEQLGRFDLFLVPVVSEDGIVYEAVFNRFKKKNP
jgi:hypothetical protein